MSGSHKELSNQLLIVDDDPLIRLLSRERLETEGFDVIEAADGQQGIRAFLEHQPSLVLLDVEMPVVSGFEVCEAIRESATGKHVPILIMTGRDDVESVLHAYEVGATDFVLKPIEWLVLTHRIRYILRASESFLAVHSQQARLDEVQQHARLGSWEVDLTSGVMTASNAFRTLINLEDDVDIIGLDEVLDRIHAEDREALKHEGGVAIANRAGFNLEHRIVARDGSVRIVLTRASVRSGERDELLALEGFSQDITEQRHAEAQIRALAYSDELTGLANRTAFKLHLEKGISHATRTANSLAVLYLDLDNFKRVNDTFGHTAGDKLLRIVADKLVGCVRDSDVVARDTNPDLDVTVSRIGGDEFTILLDGLTISSGADLVAQRVLESLSHSVFIEGHEVRVTASIGIAVWPQDGTDMESLLRNADSAMYSAKELGRANFQNYREELNSDVLERMDLEADLARTVENDQLSVHFQPILEPISCRISGSEALARWSDSRRGFVPPSEFIPLAESSGLISSIGRSILYQACRSTRMWQKDGYRDLKLAVNLSLQQIKDERLIEVIDGVLSQTDFDPRFLEFEITENSLIHDEERTLAVLDQLRSRGCRIALDDYGTGYSSLSSLKQFPVQTLKIDRSFVSGIGSNNEDEAIIDAILSMARELGIRVVAEGVETDKQLQFLVDRQCGELQGFLISRPLDPEKFRAFLDAYDG